MTFTEGRENGLKDIDKATRYKNWVFTCNNYTEDQFKQFQELKCIKYLIMGKEVGEKGTPHLQGYISLKNSKTWSSLNKVFDKKCWIAPAKGTVHKNFEYCKKQGDYVEVGDKPIQGKRTDIIEIKQMVKDGSNIRNILELETINLQTIKIAEKMLTYMEKKRNWKTKVIWCYGATGVGKSRWVEEQCKKDSQDTYYCGNTNKWWNGYDGHETVVIDDMRRDFCKFHTMLKLLDRYPFEIECKGGSRQLLAKTIYITNPENPKNFWENHTLEDGKQFLRRINQVFYFKGPNNIIEKKWDTLYNEV